MVQLTKMQQRIYDYIAQTIRTQGYPLRAGNWGRLGLKSPSTDPFSPEAHGGAGGHRQGGPARAGR